MQQSQRKREKKKEKFSRRQEQVSRNEKKEPKKKKRKKRRRKKNRKHLRLRTSNLQPSTSLTFFFCSLRSLRSDARTLSAHVVVTSTALRFFVLSSLRALQSRAFCVRGFFLFDVCSFSLGFERGKGAEFGSSEHRKSRFRCFCAPRCSTTCFRHF